MKSKRILAFLMCAVIVIAGMLSGCSAKNDDAAASTADEATIDEATQSEAATDPAATKAEETKAQKETQPATKKPEDSKKKENTTASQPTYNPPVSADTKTCTVTVANRDYKVNVGSTVTYTCYMKTPGAIEDVQAKVYYTPEALKLIDTKAAQLFPVLGTSAIFNIDSPGVVKYNAINLEGFNFTGKGALVTLRFQVLQSSSASVYSTVEYVTGVDGVPYIDAGKVASGINVTLEETFN